MKTITKTFVTNLLTFGIFVSILPGCGGGTVSIERDLPGATRTITVEGVYTDEAGEAVPGAEVTSVDENGHTTTETTGEDGRFSIEANVTNDELDLAIEELNVELGPVEEDVAAVSADFRRTRTEDGELFIEADNFMVSTFDALDFGAGKGDLDAKDDTLAGAFNDAFDSEPQEQPEANLLGDVDSGGLDKLDDELGSLDEELDDDVLSEGLDLGL